MHQKKKVFLLIAAITSISALIFIYINTFKLVDNKYLWQTDMTRDIASSLKRSNLSTGNLRFAGSSHFLRENWFVFEQTDNSPVRMSGWEKSNIIREDIDIDSREYKAILSYVMSATNIKETDVAGIRVLIDRPEGYGVYLVERKLSETPIFVVTTF